MDEAYLVVPDWRTASLIFGPGGGLAPGPLILPEEQFRSGRFANAREQSTRVASLIPTAPAHLARPPPVHGAFSRGEGAAVSLEKKLRPA